MNRLERRDESFCQETLGSVPEEDLLGPNTEGEGEVRGSGYTGNGENKVQIGDHGCGHRFWGLEIVGAEAPRKRGSAFGGVPESCLFFFFIFRPIFYSLHLKRVLN